MFAYLAVRLEPETNRVIGVCQIRGLKPLVLTCAYMYRDGYSNPSSRNSAKTPLAVTIASRMRGTPT